MAPPPVATTASLADILLRENVLSPTKIGELQAEAQRAHETLDHIIEQSGAVREEDLLRAKSALYNLPAIDLFGKIVRAEILNIIPPELAENYRMVAFNRAGDEVAIAMVDPTNFQALEAVEYLARKHNLRIKYYLTAEASLKYVLRQYESLSAEVEEALKGAEAGAAKQLGAVEISEKGLEEVVKTAPVSKIVSVVLRHAVEGKASDVHIEPVGNETRIRYRIDGILHTSLTLPKHVHSALVARIKVLSNLKIDETRVPQDGRFRMVIDGRNIDYRVSTLPLISNEKVVMRILDTSSELITLEHLGFEGKNMEVMQEAVTRSHGMFLITGPTGSGKSTTLYALLNILNEEGVNIITLEDPVEYYMTGVNQSQVNPDVGLTFAAGLRSILRQDPDIIMVGEVRDNETAALGVHAALTGHIVLSTLHTNDAIGAIPRLIDMKIEPFLIASSLNVVMAQRLVRRVCQHCKRELPMPKEMESLVVEGLHGLARDRLPKDVKLTPPLRIWQGQGCARCENSGYKGRVAISEVLEITEGMKKIIVAGGDLMENIHTEFVTQGMFSMKQDGIIKALRGLTTVEEVLDATRA
ncbi:MAG: Flp pilus assembly complex ATPase component TadA [Candidatus Kerfeldbacteria bacterium]|nr:Flp pilus assembly complex ATPase component TadA [Candidatus Kerfeldbacteria bacterium]